MFDNVQNITLSGAMIIVTLWIVDKFWNTFFERKRKNIPALFIWTFFSLFQIYFESNSGDIHIVATIFNAGLFLMISVFGYHSAGKAKYFLLMLFYAVWSLIEVFVFFFIDSLLGEKEISNKMGAVVSKILMIIFVHELSVARKNKKECVIPSKYYAFLLLIPLGSICIAINEFYTKEDTFISMLTISILLLFNVVILEIYTKLNDIFIYENERTVYVQQVEIISKNTIAQEKMMEDFYEERHNLINKLIVLKASIEKDDDKEHIVTNVNKIINNSYTLEAISNSGNITIDTLINFKYAVAREYGIAFQLKIFVPADLPIEQCDIGVVLGNAIDNAIDAARKCKNNDRILEISMGVKKEAWIIVIRNPYEHELKRDKNGNFISTKEDNQRHGYGINSIKKIVEKYQGEVITEMSGNIFSVTIVMNLGYI